MEIVQKRRVQKVTKRHSEPVTEKVESIFDYNPTEQELRRWGLRREAFGDKYDMFLEEMKKAAVSLGKPSYYQLGTLFAMRGDEKKANEYFAKADPEELEALIMDF